MIQDPEYGGTQVAINSQAILVESMTVGRQWCSQAKNRPGKYQIEQRNDTELHLLLLSGQDYQLNSVVSVVYFHL